jgi:hypothetical protein
MRLPNDDAMWALHVTTPVGVHRCNLLPFDEVGFDECLAHRRLIMIGDSNMNTLFTSLGCLLQHLSEGELATWDASNATRIKADFNSRGGTAYKQV